MRSLHVITTILTLGVGAACGSARQSSVSQPLAPALSAALDSLGGRWDFSVDLGARQTPGEMWLFRRDAQLTGTLAPSGTNTLPVREFTLRGDSAQMIVDTPEGPVVFNGQVSAAGKQLRGHVTYHQGQKYPMTATKRPAASG